MESHRDVEHPTAADVFEQIAQESDSRQEQAGVSAKHVVPANESNDKVDLDLTVGGGIPDADRLTFLMNAHNRMLSASGSEWTDEQCLQSRIAFARRCIATILHYSGRSLSSAEVASLGDAGPNEFRFSADLAWYVFFRKEFPVFDTLYDCSIDELLAAPNQETIEEQLEGLYQEALETCPGRQPERPDNPVEGIRVSVRAGPA
jgi:hypothetical protein